MRVVEYNPELLDKRRILAITKADFIDPELQKEMEQDLPDVPGVFISAVTGYGIPRLKDMIWNALEGSMLER
jgi:GTPase